jgi:hypothetical protein
MILEGSSNGVIKDGGSLQTLNGRRASDQTKNHDLFQPTDTRTSFAM